MTASIVHDTFFLERFVGASPERVFEAYADVEQRAIWGALPGEAMLYSASDFSVGGADTYRCGPLEDPAYCVSVQYQEILPCERILYVERVSTQGTPLFAALVSLEFARDGEGTRLVVTDQMASFVGRDMIDGAQRGTTVALNQWVESVGG